jgi:hypothetical protein
MAGTVAKRHGRTWQAALGRPAKPRSGGPLGRSGPLPTIHGTISDVTASTTAPPELTHPCVRCGARVPLDVGLCERCNPLGLRDSSASQVHGLALAGVAAAVVGLALAGHLAIAGVGPFDGSIVSAGPDGGGLAITLQVTNHGTSAGRTTCRVSDPADRNGGRGGLILSPQIEPGETLSFTRRVTELGPAAGALAVECSNP